VDATKPRSAMGERERARMLQAVGGAILTECKPKLVFGPLSRWRDLVGKKPNSRDIFGDSVLLGHYGGAGDLGEAKGVAKAAQTIVKVLKGRGRTASPSSTSSSPSASGLVFRTTWNSGTPRGPELRLDPLRSMSSVGYVSGVMGEKPPEPSSSRTTGWAVLLVTHFSSVCFLSCAHVVSASVPDCVFDGSPVVTVGVVAHSAGCAGAGDSGKWFGSVQSRRVYPSVGRWST
jgi:hypothetical protein